jgi:hypothetical protein
MSDQPFIIKFDTMMQKDPFLKRYFTVAKSLILKKLGIDKNVSFYSTKPQ